MHRTGLESEFHVIDAPTGALADAAPLLGPGREAEASAAVVELISPPYATLDALADGVRDGYAALASLAEEHGRSIIPTSALGRRGVRSRQGKERWTAFRRRLGEESAATYRATAGLHLHFDLDEDAYGQFNQLRALDPAAAFLATSPYLLGRNTVLDGRLKARNDAFADFPLHGKEQPYLGGPADHEALATLRHAIWTRGMTDEEAAGFATDDTNWGPLRLRTATTTKPATIEARNSDIAPYSLVVGQAALYHGSQQNPERTLPRIADLDALAERGIRHGLHDDAVHAYLAATLERAAAGLPADVAERHLRAHRAMLAGRTTLADVISAYAHSIGANGTINESRARSVNKYVRELFEDDLQDPARTISTIQGVARNGAAHFRKPRAWYARPAPSLSPS